jgi:hypothetical protein
MDAAMMNSKPFSYERFLGARYGRLATPAIFIDNLRQHGRTPIDPLQWVLTAGHEANAPSSMSLAMRTASSF